MLTALIQQQGEAVQHESTVCFSIAKRQALPQRVFRAGEIILEITKYPQTVQRFSVVRMILHIDLQRSLYQPQARLDVSAYLPVLPQGRNISQLIGSAMDTSSRACG